jgi:hypothetical protein
MTAEILEFRAEAFRGRVKDGGTKHTEEEDSELRKEKEERC